jgi:predicted metal-binding integral membrane protein DUF2182
MRATLSLLAQQPLLSPQARAGLRSPAFRWSLAPALVAWLALLWLAGEAGALEICIAPRAHLADGVAASIAATVAAVDPLRWAGEWALMFVAMMFPLLVPAIDHVAARSFAARRDRSVALFVVGYVLIWLGTAAAASIFLVVARGTLAGLGFAASAGVIGGALAALWQVTAAKRRAVRRCHGTIALRPFGWPADRDAASYGLLHGVRCVRACAPTMILPLIGGQGVTVMAVVFAILLAERARPTPQFRLSATALVLLGLTTIR